MYLNLRLHTQYCPKETTELLNCVLAVTGSCVLHRRHADTKAFADAQELACVHKHADPQGCRSFPIL